MSRFLRSQNRSVAELREASRTKKAAQMPCYKQKRPCYKQKRN